MKLLVILNTLIGFSHSAVPEPQPIIEKLLSQSWTGSGTLMGAKADFEMRWSPLLNGKFLQLQFKNERTSADGTKMVFEAVGMYKITDGRVEGTWFDGRGVTLPLSGEVTDTQLVIFWGTPDIEQGKTVYSLADSQIRVTDYILTEGEYKQFGSALYK